MTYRQLFDHLGNPIAKPSRQPIGHTIVQSVSAITIVVLLVLLYAGRL